MTEIVFEREGPKAASIYLIVENGQEIQMGYNQTLTAWGLNRWLQRTIHQVYTILKEANPERVVTIREEK